jgi:membrane protein implicated in regulation of membrane protease activity
MTGWFVWVIAAVVFGVGAMLTNGFRLAPLALGAALAAVTDAAGAGSTVVWIVFVLVALLSWLALRPLARSRREASSPIRTGAAALVGKEAIVVERIANDEGVGCIRIDDEVWTARAMVGDQVIERGARVDVVQSRGATALVMNHDVGHGGREPGHRRSVA